MTQIPAAVSLPLPFFTPTRAFPIPFISRWSLGGTANRLSYQFNRFTAIAYGGMINTFRRNTPGLAPLSRWTDYLTTPASGPVPVLYCFSPRSWPSRPTTPPHAHITGYWFLPDDTTWQPSPQLESFLAAGEPPLYIGFGSMGFGKNAAERGRTILEAVRWVGTRAVVATGWGGIDVPTSPAEDILVLRTSPTPGCSPAPPRRPPRGRWHHRCRSPRRTPQPHLPRPRRPGLLGRTHLQLGRRPSPTTGAAVHNQKLTERIDQLLTQRSYQATAADLGEAIRSEDGTGQAIQALEHIV